MLTPEEAMAEYTRPAKRHSVTVTVTEVVHQRIVGLAEERGISAPEVVKSALRVFFSMLEDGPPEKAQSAPADEPKETKPQASSRSRRRPPKPKPDPEPETEAEEAEDPDEDTSAAPEGADSEFDDWD